MKKQVIALIFSVAAFTTSASSDSRDNWNKPDESRTPTKGKIEIDSSDKQPDEVKLPPRNSGIRGIRGVDGGIGTWNPRFGCSTMRASITQPIQNFKNLFSDIEMPDLEKKIRPLKALKEEQNKDKPN